ncbi:carbohydrate porin [Undibacterium sp. Jales W-56]|uniref:maltoporin n=1 Tax=Undibacterium sp. Jales W-56 TaxID=2897325 RepID=UPI0021CFB3CD|nr:carbohydrate porin [Undibacterium sp. Jales W-56]MCU6434037.1 carbohydrate porin [Undibacterium sp. Jales W-56]
MSKTVFRAALKALPLALSLTFAAGLAHASEAEGEFHGYFRAGVGSSSTHGPQSCFGLGGNTMNYRLGNECDSYFEGGYTKELAKADNGVSFVGTVWLDAYKNGSDFGNAKPEIAKAYVEAKNLDFLNGGVAWIGKRYYFRPDIHMLDLQYINLNGTGGGFDKIGAGPGKFSYALFKDNDTNVIDPVTGKVTSTNAALRQNFIYEGLPVNAGGTLDAAISLISAQGENKHNGWQFSIFHKQDKFMGGSNTLGFQYGVGPGTGVGGPCCDRIGSSGSTTLGSDVTRLRIFDDLVIQPTEQFSMEFIALMQRDKSNAQGSSTWTTLGARPVYALTKNLKIQAELGTSRVTQANGGDALRLTKLTIAPTITVGQGYWSRPELRAFVTYGKWNNAATAAVNASNNSGPVYGNNTSGTSVGIHLETWF